jgi:excisionase family DNA binding protein
MFSVEAAADLLSISRTRMFLLIKRGGIKSVRVGRLRRIPADALIAYVDQLVSADADSIREDI